MWGKRAITDVSFGSHATAVRRRVVRGAKFANSQVAEAFVVGEFEVNNQTNLPYSSGNLIRSSIFEIKDCGVELGPSPKRNDAHLVTFEFVYLL
jgi:hypothetical protein